MTVYSRNPPGRVAAAWALPAPVVGASSPTSRASVARVALTPTDRANGRGMGASRNDQAARARAHAGTGPPHGCEQCTECLVRIGPVDTVPLRDVGNCADDRRAADPGRPGVPVRGQAVAAG